MLFKGNKDRSLFWSFVISRVFSPFAIANQFLLSPWLQYYLLVASVEFKYL